MQKLEHAIAPVSGEKAELVLQTHHVEGSIVGELCRTAIGSRLSIVDDVHDSPAFIAKRLSFLDRSE